MFIIFFSFEWQYYKKSYSFAFNSKKITLKTINSLLDEALV